VPEEEPVAARPGDLVDAAQDLVWNGSLMSRMITPRSELRLPRRARARRFGL
jgi:hypothetical protein